MSNPRYAVRSALFAAAYLAACLAAAATPFAPVPPLAAGAIWLAAQSGHGRRRLDVIMLATAAAVAATLEGAGLLMAATVAVWAVVPALAFAMLLERWLPGYWRGHGDRFRRPRAALGPLAGAAALSAAAGVILAGVIDTGLDPATAAFHLSRDTAALILLTLGVRALRHSRKPRRPGLVVR
ncbi:hypothetical protein AB0G04_42820 [Actinoplanes sp. NPDC023801]|uniref:hypothetical protein n=1 Tax=Actinoplanes sp. NPDC023801 TaxID=3154595 RepID=UPI00340935A8